MKKVDIFGIQFSVVNYQQATELVMSNARQRKAYSVFALPVAAILEYRADSGFRAAVDTGSLIVPDGQPIKWAMNYFYKTGLQDRVYGPALMKYVLAQANKDGLKIFLYGGKTQQVLDDLISVIETDYPQLDICGSYREEVLGQPSMSAQEINERQPNIVFVGTGCPVQEKWIAANLDQIDAAVMGVGAAFSYHSGHSKSPPGWMQKMGLEWLFRLSQEPRRLFFRYLTANSLFVFLVAGRWLSGLFGNTRSN